jgi:hypothetical protein
MTPEQEFEAVPGRSLGPFEIGMSEESLPDEFEYEPQPGAAGLPGFVLVKGLPVKLHTETSDTPGTDEIEVAAGFGLGVRLDGVELLGRPVDEVLADLEGEGIETPQEDPEDPGSYHARGWSFWAPDGTIEGVVVERPEFFDDPPEL